MGFRYLLFALCCLPCLCEAQEAIRFYQERVLQLGDDMAWADPTLDHSDWDPAGSTHEIGNFWVRMRLVCDSLTDTFSPAGLQVISMGSYEVYWDGVRIGENGKVGVSRETEIPGTFISQIWVPDSLMAHGLHTVAFRVSNYHGVQLGMESWNHFFLEPYMFSQQHELKLAVRMFVLAGIYLMAGMYYLLLFLLRKRETVGLIFSIMCFLFFALIIMEYLKFLYAYPYPFHYLRLGVIFSLNFSISFLTPVFFILYFQVPNKGLLSFLVFIGLSTISLQYLPGTDTTNQYLSSFLWWVSFATAIYAIVNRKKGAWVIFSALLVAGGVVVLHEIQFQELIFSYDVNLFISFSLLVIAMMYLLAQRAREQRMAYEASLLLSSRLQNELLKKNIQPHFIMNTLTSLMGWIEESPKDSVQFIEALSKEFEIMSEIAEKKLIPVAQEIALCKHHIEIMKFRKEVRYLFEYPYIPQEEKVPPAVFHTLVENGISHSLPGENNEVKMLLEYTKTRAYTLYSFHTIAQNRTSGQKEEGTGLTYIRSRLKENYGEDWRMESKATPQGWITHIHLFHR